MLLLLTTLLFDKRGDFHVGLTLGVFTRCYSHHHGYFLFLHLIICLNSVGDRDGEMGWLLSFHFISCLIWTRSKIDSNPVRIANHLSPLTTSKAQVIQKQRKFSFSLSENKETKESLSQRSWNALLLLPHTFNSPSLPHTLQAATFDGCKLKQYVLAFKYYNSMSHFNISWILLR